MLIRCFDSTNSIWSFHFVVSGFSNAKVFSLQTAEPSIHKKSSAIRTTEAYPFTKIFIRSIAVHKPLCLSLQMAYYPLRLSVCSLSNGISKLIQNIRSLLFRLKSKIWKTYVIIIIIQPLGRTGLERLSVQKKTFNPPTIWPRSPLYHVVNRNRRCFDSV